jgi:hypothetical protein
MTDAQIQNWRNVIFRILEEKCEGAGAYALIMPKEEIEKFRDKMQEDINNLKIDNDEERS